MRSPRTHWLTAAVGSILFASLGLGSCGPAKTGRPIRRAHGAVLARVNGQPIDQASTDRMIRLLQLKGSAPADSLPGNTPEARLRYLAAERLIDRELALQDAFKRGISADTARVSDGYRQITSHTGMDSSLIRGMSEQDIRQYLADDIVFNTYLQRTVIDSIQVSDEEMKAYMLANHQLFETPESARVRQILIALDTELAAPAVKLAARKQAEKILAEVRTPGADFAAIAKVRSKDTNSAPNGGDLGILARGQTVPAFDSAAFDLAPGEISGVVETPYGYHIIKLEEKFGASTRSLESVRLQLTTALRQEKAQQAIRARLLTLRQRAKITYS